MSPSEWKRKSLFNLAVPLVALNLQKEGDNHKLKQTPYYLQSWTIEMIEIRPPPPPPPPILMLKNKWRIFVLVKIH